MDSDLRLQHIVYIEDEKKGTRQKRKKVKIELGNELGNAQTECPAR